MYRRAMDDGAEFILHGKLGYEQLARMHAQCVELVSCWQTGNTGARIKSFARR